MSDTGSKGSRRRGQRRGLGTNPLDALDVVVPRREEVDVAKVRDHIGTRRVSGTGRSRFTSYISDTLAEKVRDAVFWTPGLTVAALVDKALRDEVERRERERGGPFPRRDGELSSGVKVRESTAPHTP